jgi:hypothetical protein
MLWDAGVYSDRGRRHNADRSRWILLLSCCIRWSPPDAYMMCRDERFLQTLEYGMPLCGHAGMGIVRPLMALSGLDRRVNNNVPDLR